MSLPIKILLIQLIPSSVRFSEFRKAVFHDTTLYVSAKYSSAINEVQHQSVFVQNFKSELS